MSEQLAEGAERYPGYERELECLVDLMRRAGSNDEHGTVDYSSTIEHRRVADLMDAGFKAREGLAKALGMGPDYRRELSVAEMPNLMEDQDFRVLRDFLSYNTTFGGDDEAWNAVRYTDAEGRSLATSVAEGKVKVGRTEFRLGRLLNAKVPKEDWTNYRAAVENWEWRYPIVQKYATLNDLVTVLRDRCTAGSKKRRAMLTLNPLDIMLTSEEASYRSCHSFDGIHAAGNTAYVRNQYTAVLVVLDDSKPDYPFYKTGRAMCFFPQDAQDITDGTYRRVLVGRPYGSIFAPQADAAVRHIEGWLSEGQGLENKWVGTYNARWKADSDGPVYVDCDVLRFGYHSSIGQDAKDDYGCVRFGAATCLCCGDRHDDEQSHGYLVCMDCSGIGGEVCQRCDERADEVYGVRDRHGDWLDVCYDCQDSYYTRCRECGDYHPDDLVNESLSGRMVCQECLEAGDWTTCEDCGGFDRSSKFTYVEGKYGTEAYCENCADDHVAECGMCSEKRSKDACRDLYVDGQPTAVCEDCQEDLHVCDRCSRHTGNEPVATGQLSLVPGAEPQMLTLCEVCAAGHCAEGETEEAAA